MGLQRRSAKRCLHGEGSVRHGAVVAGRRTYDDSLAYWGAHGPTGPRRTPVFVVTHEARGTSPENGVYRFETGGLAAAIQAARLIARDKDVSVMGGANIGQQAIREGLVDEVAISLVPLILGGGVRLFEHLEGKQIRLDPIDIPPHQARDASDLPADRLKRNGPLQAGRLMLVEEGA
jgi:dihydrofolate reductase